MNPIEHPHPAHEHQSLGESEGGNNEHPSPSSPTDEEGDYKKGADPEKLKTGRRKINIEFIEDKSRRHITFSKRKAGIMKKAYELSTLTGTQVLLLVASETGHVYTFATPKLQPLITKPEGKNLIQSCLNAPEVSPVATAAHHQPRIQGYNEPPIMYPTSELPREPPMESVGYDEEKKQEQKSSYPLGMDMNSYSASATYPPPNLMPSYMSAMGSAGIPRGYMSGQYAQPPHSQYPTSSAVQGQYAQPQYSGASSGGYPPNMHGMPAWQNKQGGMQSMPMGQMSQGQASQAQSPSISGLIQSKQGEHAVDHST